MKIKSPHFALFQILMFLLISPKINAQELSNKVKIGVSITPISTRAVGPFEKLDGAGSLSSRKYFAGDISVILPLNNRFSIQSGITFSKQEISVEGAVVDPAKDVFRDTTKMKIFEIPVLANMNFGKFFYANLGPMLHFDFSGQQQVLDKQNGIGMTLGLGANYPISSQFSIYLEPDLKIYSLLPFESKTYYDRITQLGVKVGLRYSIW